MEWRVSDSIPRPLATLSSYPPRPTLWHGWCDDFPPTFQPKDLDNLEPDLREVCPVFRTKIWIVVSLLALPLGAKAATPTEKCVAEKEKASGKYAQCRLVAESRFAKSGDAVKLGLSLDRCVQKLQKGFEKVDLKYGLACPTSADTATIDDFMTEASDQVVSYLGTGSPEPGAGFCGPSTEFDPIWLECLPVVTCGNAQIDGDEQCDGTDLGGATCNSLVANTSGTLGCTPICQYDLSGCSGKDSTLLTTGETRCWGASDPWPEIPCSGTGQDGEVQAGQPFSYTDNGDGTVTDNVTHLTWEKLSYDLSIHDWWARYSWEEAFTVKIAELNTPPCFAGHCDWRVPNYRELGSIVDFGKVLPNNSGPAAIATAFNTNCTSGCTVLTCSCTNRWIHWASNTHVNASFAKAAFGVDFASGLGSRWNKDETYHVRAVRGPK